MEAVNGPVEEQEPEPPPVKNIEYPSFTAASGAVQYAALPYGSDFDAESPGAAHSETTSPVEEAASAGVAAEAAPTHSDLSAGAGEKEAAGSSERKS
jgi:hypothetical protein